MGIVLREFLIGGFAVLAGLGFGSAAAAVWRFAMGAGTLISLLETPGVISGVLGAAIWLFLFVRWRHWLAPYKQVGVLIFFVGFASLTGLSFFDPQAI